MDYSQLSDFEINKRVAIAQGFAPDICDIAKRGSSLVGVEWDEDTGCATKVLNYCNNPADAWPIISANRISVEYDAERQCDVPAEWVTAYVIDDLKVHIVAHQPCDKALRSAMIVFLMMQDAKHA
ncbi:phage protein NinX family protein [Salmonella enterica]|nr:DUF2591 family protein [Salmonella enterica]